MMTKRRKRAGTYPSLRQLKPDAIISAAIIGSAGDPSRRAATRASKGTEGSLLARGRLATGLRVVLVGFVVASEIAAMHGVARISFTACSRFENQGFNSIRSLSFPALGFLGPYVTLRVSPPRSTVRFT
jgi:hypothetical protein